ncbi:MAG TPA: protein phosphatase 2C domain-containing protein [Gemmatimonadales bacterium]|jgi:protein phosphatase|nr:protein phosphatase 2C domain-containing protein [Gemmatimonadales bacterium]
MTSQADSAPLRRPTREDLDLYGLSHPGRIRRENQDHFLIASLHKTMQVHATSLPQDTLGRLTSPNRGYVFLVADGVGGVPGGTEASRTALRAIVDYVVDAMDLYTHLEPDLEPAFLEELQRSVEQSHEAVRRSGSHEEDAAGATTLTMVCIRWPRAYLVHVGDSRCYRLREGRLEQLTRDQTMAQAMVDAGALTAAQAEVTPLRHVLYSALGGRRAEPFVFTTDCRWEDVMLLCTDGLTKHVTDAEIRDSLAHATSAERACHDLVGLALERGGTDNVTAVVGRLRPFPPPPGGNG